MDLLPTDILELIIQLLPLASVLNFRLLSKRCLSIPTAHWWTKYTCYNLVTASFLSSYRRYYRLIQKSLLVEEIIGYIGEVSLFDRGPYPYHGVLRTQYSLDDGSTIDIFQGQYTVRARYISTNKGVTNIDRCEKECALTSNNTSYDCSALRSILLHLCDQGVIFYAPSTAAAYHYFEEPSARVEYPDY